MERRDIEELAQMKADISTLKTDVHTIKTDIKEFISSADGKYARRDEVEHLRKQLDKSDQRVESISAKLWDLSTKVAVIGAIVYIVLKSFRVM